MKTRWTYADLFDLEYFLAQDRGRDQAELHQRDRQIYLDGGGHRQKDSSSPQSSGLIRLWLKSRLKEQFSGEPGKSFGRSISESIRSLYYLLVLLSLFIGLLAGLSFFSYSGTTPVNVLHFLFLFIFSQLFFLALLGISAVLRLFGFDALPTPIVSLYSKLATWVAGRAGQLGERLSGEHRGAYRQFLGILNKQRLNYGSVFYWPMFRLSQSVMVGFNFGLLTATLYRLTTSDIAFGWQSTIQFSSGFIHRLVQILALPWSWLIPGGYAAPTAAEIEGSRIILKEGIYHLATSDLISWWPFLLLCLLFYGLILRLALIFTAGLFQRRALQKSCDRRPELLHLVQRMLNPLVSSQAGDQQINGSSFDGCQPTIGEVRADFPLVLLLSTDIGEDTGPDQLFMELTRQGFAISEKILIGSSYQVDHQTLQALSGYRWEETGLLLVMEAWMPPIQDNLSFLRQLRQAVGRQTPIFVALLGQQAPQGTSRRPTAVEQRVWQQKLDALADPALSLFLLSIPPHNHQRNTGNDT